VGTEKTSVEISIEAQNRAASALGQSIADVKRWSDEVTRARAAADGSYQSNLRLGQAVLNQAAAQRALHTEMAKVTQGTTALQAAQAELQGAMQSVTSGLGQQVAAISRVAASMGPVGIAVSAVIAGLTLFGTVAISAAGRIGEFQHQVDIMRDTTGLSSKEIGGLRVAAARAGETFEDVQAPLFMFVRHLGEARDGSKEAQKAFQTLGVSLTDSNGFAKSTGTVLEDVKAALFNIPDPARRASEAFELFGRGARTILPVLEQNQTEAQALAEQLGITLTPSMEKTAEAARKAGLEFKLSMLGELNKFTAALAPAGTAILNWANGAIASFDKFGTWFHEHMLGWLDDLDQFRKETQDQGKATPPPGIVDFGTIKTVSPGPNQAMKDLVKQARDQYEQTKITIPLLEYQRSIGAITLDQEIKKLEALRQQALTVQEIAIISKELYNLTKGRPYGPTLSDEEWTKLLNERSTEYMARPERQEGVNGGPPQFRVIPAYGDSAYRPALAVAAAAETGTKQLKLLSSAISALGSGIGSAIIGLTQGANRFETFMKTIASAILEFVAQLIKSSIVGTIGGFIGSLIGGAGSTIASGAVFAQQGGMAAPRGSFANPYFAQSGLITNGVRGLDGVHAMLGRDEAILRHNETDSWSRVLMKLDKFIDRVATPSASGSRSGALRLDGFRSPTPRLGTRGPSRADFRTEMGNEIWPMLREVLSTGAYR